MNQFYVSIIFLGITLIVISLVSIAYDRKKAHDFSEEMDSKKAELVGIINDAEQMVEELNKFSDYIVTQMDLKNAELTTSLKAIDEKIKHINTRIQENVEVKAVHSEMVVNGSPVGLYGKPTIPKMEYAGDLVIDRLESEKAGAVYTQSVKLPGRTRDKVISINSRHREVMILAENGLNDTEIARRLNMGKGEVQLILGVNNIN